MPTSSDPEKTGKYAATQAVAEIGLGSIVHALHIPFGGHLLSLNQGFILGLATKKSNGRREGVVLASSISSVAAILKSLSPAGSRLTPMLAISVQGALFSLGLATLGMNLAGVLLGMILLSLWAFTQPLLLAYFLFGTDFFEALQKLWFETARITGISPDYGVRVLAGIVGIKLLIAMALGVGARVMGAGFEKKYIEKIVTLTARSQRVSRSEKTTSKAWMGALRDLTNPWFVISLVLSLGFFVLSKNPGGAQVWLYGFRTLAVAWLVFWTIRAMPTSWVQQWGGSGLAAAVAHLKQLSGHADGDLGGGVATQCQPDGTSEP